MNGHPAAMAGQMTTGGKPSASVTGWITSFKLADMRNLLFKIDE